MSERESCQTGETKAAVTALKKTRFTSVLYDLANR